MKLSKLEEVATKAHLNTATSSDYSESYWQVLPSVYPARPRTMCN